MIAIGTYSDGTAFPSAGGAAVLLPGGQVFVLDGAAAAELYWSVRPGAELAGALTARRIVGRDRYEVMNTRL